MESAYRIYFAIFRNTTLIVYFRSFFDTNLSTEEADILATFASFKTRLSSGYNYDPRFLQLTQKEEDYWGPVALPLNLWFKYEGMEPCIYHYGSYVLVKWLSRPGFQLPFQVQQLKQTHSNML